MAAIIKLSQNEWVKIFCANGGNQSWQVWVSLREKTKVAESKMAQFKMAAIIKLSQNDWVWVRLNWFESESECRESVFEWIWEKKTRCLNPTWQNSRWLPSSRWVRMNEWSFLHPTWKNTRWLPSTSWVKMNEWRIFMQMVGTNLGKCEWVWEEKLRWLNPRWPNSRWQNSRWLPSASWVRMNKFESDWISLSQESEWRESVFEWIWEKKTRCLNPTWQCLNPTW